MFIEHLFISHYNISEINNEIALNKTQYFSNFRFSISVNTIFFFISISRLTFSKKQAYAKHLLENNGERNIFDFIDNFCEYTEQCYRTH